MPVNIPNYEVIIPTYNRPKLLDGLLTQLRKANSFKSPSRVIVVDDCSSSSSEYDDIRQKHSDEKMRVAMIHLKEQGGMFPAIRVGLNHIKTKYVVVCTDDLRLAVQRGRKYLYGHLPNPCCTLVHYLESVDRYLESDDEAREKPCGIVFPWICAVENPSLIFSADHEIYSLKRGLLPLVTNLRHEFDVNALIPTEEFDFREVSFGHWYCFALNMDHYASTDGFDPQFDPYPYGLWDLCLQLREKEITCYSSINSVMFHRSLPYNKQPGSLSNIIFDEKKALANANAFYNKWSDKSLRYLNRHLNPIETRFVEEMGHNFF